MRTEELLRPYNPWWEDVAQAFSRLPSFQRPIFGDIFRGLKGIPQIISITGPRRVGDEFSLFPSPCFSYF